MLFDVPLIILLKMVTKVTPIHKGGSQSELGRYRLIHGLLNSKIWTEANDVNCVIHKTRLDITIDSKHSWHKKSFYRIVLMQITIGVLQ